MKLKLNHITPYISHKLSVMYDGYACEVEGVDLHVKDTIIVERINVELKDIKPILRPLSDLSNVIEIDDERFIPIVKLNEDCITAGDEDDFIHYKPGFADYININCEGTDQWNLLAAPFNAIQLLVEWHFDVFDLIDAGLAIDINTLK